MTATAATAAATRPEPIERVEAPDEGDDEGDEPAAGAELLEAAAPPDEARLLAPPAAALDEAGDEADEREALLVPERTDEDGQRTGFASEGT